MMHGEVEHIDRRLSLDDLLVGVGIALITVGAFLAWPPAAFIILGSALVLVVRYGATTEE